MIPTSLPGKSPDFCTCKYRNNGLRADVESFPEQIKKTKKKQTILDHPFNPFKTE